jgi:hypothetical protein
MAIVIAIVMDDHLLWEEASVEVCHLAEVCQEAMDWAD